MYAIIYLTLVLILWKLLEPNRFRGFSTHHAKMTGSKKAAAETAPKNAENFFIRQEEFGVLYYSKSKTPVFEESYFVDAHNLGSQFILSAPIIAILEITGRCQLNCIHCYRPPEKKDKSLDLETIKRLIHELHSMEVVGVQFIGGEPFMHPDLLEMLREAKRPGMKTEVITNGFGITTSKIDECSDLIDGLYVSLDGKREIHNRMRQNPKSFDFAVDTLKRFSDKGGLYQSYNDTQ